MSKGRKLGDLAERFAISLLQERGYSATLLSNNYPTYDLQVHSTVPFRISVKASRNKQHVRLGSLASVKRLEKGNFVFAFMPIPGKADVQLRKNGYRLLIIPAEVACRDGIAVRKTYLAARGLDESYSYSLMVKGYARRQHQIDTWAAWNQYEDGWHQLPPA